MMQNAYDFMKFDLDNLPPVVTVAQAAMLLGWHQSQVYRAIADGSIPAWRPSARRVYIERDVMLDLIERQRRGERIWSR